MTSPKVSIIIPNYNHARFLEKRLQSVLNQTYQDFEVIYLDDASTDNSNEVFSRFAGDKHIRAYFNKINSSSPFKQWNKGVGLASGEYIWIAESDDFADERFLEELVPHLDMNPEVGLAFCKSWQVDEQDNIIAAWEEWIADLNKDRWRENFIGNGKEECKRHFTVGNTIANASAVLIRRNIYEEAGYADETMKICGDWLLWIKMLMLSDIAFVAKPLNYFRLHQNTVRRRTFTNGIRIKEDYRVLSYIAHYLEISEESLEQVCDRITGQWVNSMVSIAGWIPWRRNRSIYQVAQTMDPILCSRLIKKMLLRIPRAIGRRLRIKKEKTRKSQWRIKHSKLK